MPRNQELQKLHYKEWRLVTVNDVEDITFLVQSGKMGLRVAGTDRPSNDDASWPYARGQGETKKPLNEYTPAAGRRVWMTALSLSGATVVISHA